MVPTATPRWMCLLSVLGFAVNARPVLTSGEFMIKKGRPIYSAGMFGRLGQADYKSMDVRHSRILLGKQV